MSNNKKLFVKMSIFLLGITSNFLMCGCRDDETLMKCGNEEYREGRYDKAIKYFNTVLATNPYNVKAYLGRGNSWAEKKEFEKALKDYNELIKIDPLFDHGYYARGYLWAELGDVDKAISDYTKTINLNPNYISAYINRADLLKKQDQMKQALEDYTVILTLTPNDTQILCLRGYLLVTLGKYSEAISDYSKAIVINPKIVKAFSGRADAWYISKNYERAIRDYQSAIRLQSDDLISYNSLAFIFATCPDSKYRNGQQSVELAKKSLQIALSLSAADYLPDIYDTLAAAFAETGDFESAIRYQLKALQCGQGDMSDYKKHMLLYQEKNPLRL